MFSHSVWLYRISHFFLLVIFSCNYFVVCTISRCWFFQHFKENPLLEWVEFSKWTELCSLATNNLQTSFLIAATQRDKKAFLSFMYNTAFNKGHTQSQLWVYRFSVALSFSHSLICQSPLPQVSIFLYMPTLCVYVFLAISFLYLHLLSLSGSACKNAAITPWPGTWLTAHSLYFNSLNTK